jgi:putative transposase
MWACDFLQVTDLLFHPLFTFFVVELASRWVVHVGVSRSPTDAWAAQQLREATPEGQSPQLLIRDNDGKLGADSARAPSASGIEVLRTPPGAPRANAVCERFLGSVRRECVNHVLLLSEKRLRRVLVEYVGYFNRARPHQGIGQRIPVPGEAVRSGPSTHATVIAVSVLGGLHHEYRPAA